MTKILDTKCTICNKLIEDSTDLLYDKDYKMIHKKCLPLTDIENNLENIIIGNMLLTKGGLHEYYGGTFTLKHIKDGCHWINLRNIDIKNSWNFFTDTFDSRGEDKSVVTGIVDCACGILTNKEIGLLMSVPEIINEGIKLGLVNDYSNQKTTN